MTTIPSLYDEIEGNTLWFGPNGKIVQAPFLDHYPRNSRICGNHVEV